MFENIPIASMVCVLQQLCGSLSMDVYCAELRAPADSRSLTHAQLLLFVAG